MEIHDQLQWNFFPFISSSSFLFCSLRTLFLVLLHCTSEESTAWPSLWAPVGCFPCTAAPWPICTYPALLGIILPSMQQFGFGIVECLEVLEWGLKLFMSPLASILHLLQRVRTRPSQPCHIVNPCIHRITLLIFITSKSSTLRQTWYIGSVLEVQISKSKAHPVLYPEKKRY